MKPGTSVIHHFHVILTGQSVSCIIFMTQGHLQGQKVPFQGHISKNTSFNNNAKNMCNTSFSWDFVSKIYLWYYFDPRSSSRSKGHFQGRKQNGRHYFKVKYDFSTNEARNKCNTSFLCEFDWAIRFLFYFYDSRSSSRSKPQFQGRSSSSKSLLYATFQHKRSFKWHYNTIKTL